MGRLSRTVTHDGIYINKEGKETTAYIKWMGRGWTIFNKTTNTPITNTAYAFLADITQFKMTNRNTKEAATV